MNDEQDKELEDELLRLGKELDGESTQENVTEKDLKLDIYYYVLALEKATPYKKLIEEFGNEAKPLIKELLKERKVTQYNKGNKFYFKAIT